jgi:predicted glycogen debranching enzyme
MNAGVEIQDSASVIRVGVDSDQSRRQMDDREWLLTDGAGGYAMGTVSGIPTRRYHGLLVSALLPPVERMMLLHSTADILWLHPDTPRARPIDLASLVFGDGTRLAGGPERLVQFEVGDEAVWKYDVGDCAVLTKRLYLHEYRAAATLRYELEGAHGLLECRPLLGLRDHHHLNHNEDEHVRLAGTACGKSATIQRGSMMMTLDAVGGTSASFLAKPDWWRGLTYRIEASRGYDHTESLFCPGSFYLGLEEPAMIIARLGGHAEDQDLHAWPPVGLAEKQKRIELDTRATLRDSGHDEHEDWCIEALVRAADQFVVRRAATPRAARDESCDLSILAGYPWFADWGRDAMISMPGLMLNQGRVKEAASLLTTFAHAEDRGMIPNRFSDDDGEPEYNTVDASLWFIHAVCKLAEVCDDRKISDQIRRELIPACLEVVDGYVAGTRYGIRVDPVDGLVMAGDETTQLTWMDAQRDGTVFTPRYGKPVEIQALWQSSLRSLAALVEASDAVRSRDLTARADVASESIRRLFWSEEHGCAYDRLEPTKSGWRQVFELRPNQLFLVSLPHVPISIQRAKSLVKECREHLWTPMGMRTLDVHDGAYRGRFDGSIRELDAAYHNGTAWPWLLGPMAEAWLVAHEYSPEACHEARHMVSYMVKDLIDPASSSLGQSYEVYDGDTGPKPQMPGGCPAQAWSIAEVLRVLLLVRRCESAKA